MPPLPAKLRHRLSAEPNGHRLTAEIIALSEATTWDAAKLEWALESVYFTKEPGTCLCGHRPIIEHCLIVNQLNGNEAIVGNVCVKRFLGLPSDRLFAGINRIAADLSRALNADTIDYAHRKRWISDWEYEFSLNTARKRKPTEKQLEKRQQINEKVLFCVRRSGNPAA